MLEHSSFRFGVNLDHGAAGWHWYHGDKQMVNIADFGRQMQMSYYFNGLNPSEVGFGRGQVGNPVTIVAVGGVTWPVEHTGKKTAPLPGKCLRPLLAGEARAPHEALYFHLFRNRAVIQGDMKLVSDWDQPWQLNNLATDRTEFEDLAKSEPGQTARLQKMWEDWYAKVSEKRYTPGSDNPIYRRQADDSEMFHKRIGIPGETQEEAKPKQRKRKQARTL